MTYKGYAAKIEYGAADVSLIGRILGINDVIAFEGDSVTEIRQAFEEAVDDYLALCAKIGQSPQKPFSGEIMLRVAPEVHAELALQAQLSGKSVNSLVIDALKDCGVLKG
jgi:predicted HicB family RNase H-like nuclease